MKCLELLSSWETAGLLKPNSVKPLLSSLETNLVRRKLGKLSPSDLDQVRALFTRIFELLDFRVHAKEKSSNADYAEKTDFRGFLY